MLELRKDMVWQGFLWVDYVRCENCGAVNINKYEDIRCSLYPRQPPYAIMNKDDREKTLKRGYININCVGCNKILAIPLSHFEIKELKRQWTDYLADKKFLSGRWE